MATITLNWHDPHRYPEPPNPFDVVLAAIIVGLLLVWGLVKLSHLF